MKNLIFLSLLLNFIFLKKIYDFTIIGNGLIGSSASKYISNFSKNLTLIIGIKEPINRSIHEGPYSSHYDEGRIVREIET
jgi:sarcosine oxidase